MLVIVDTIGESWMSTQNLPQEHNDATKEKLKRFHTSAAIRALEAQKEEQQVRRLQRREEAQRKKKEEMERLAERERRLRLFEEERYFRLSLIDAINALTLEVVDLRTAIEDGSLTQDAETRKILRGIASCIGRSDYRGLADIRAKYIPKGWDWIVDSAASETSTRSSISKSSTVTIFPAKSSDNADVAFSSVRANRVIVVAATPA